MKLDIVRWGRDEIEFLVEGAPLPLLNAIRRYSLAKVPTYAIDEVMVIVNTSAMFDEILAHRLAMIPLRSEESLERQEVEIDICSRCSSSEEKPPAEICEKCYIHMTIEAEANSDEMTVYSGGIKSEDPYIKPVYSNIPIVVLAPGQRISLELKARLGRGLEHAKWSPATISVVRHAASVVIDESRCSMCGKCVEVCPKNVFGVDGGKIVVRDVYSCTLCRQCIYVCQPGALSVSIDENRNIVRIESSGSLNPETIVRKSATILLSELNAISELVKQWKLGEVR